MKQCIKCLNEDISTIVDKNRIFYHCHNCGSIKDRALDTSNQIMATRENGLIKHVTVAAMVKKNGKILFTNRKNFPFGLCFPCGHLEYNETPEKAVERELLEEVGLTVKRKKIIFNQTIFDQCKAGGDLHEWYLYDCETEGEVISNSEMDNIVWVKENDLKNVNLVLPAKIVLSKIGLLEYSGKEKIVEEFKQNYSNSTTRLIEETVIENLPMDIILTKKNGNLSFLNKSARELLSMLKQNDPKGYEKFVVLLSETAKSSIKKSIEISCSSKCNLKDYEIKSTPLNSANAKFGATLIVKSISSLHKQEVKDVIAYQSSLALSTSSSSSKIIKTILKQLMFSFNVNSCNLMLFDMYDKLSVAFKYSKNEKSSSKPSILLKMGEGVAGKVASLKTPLAIPNTSNEPSFIKKSKNSHSLLSLPVISSGKVLGILNITRPKNCFFTEDEVSMATIVANRIALALESENLYRSLKKEKYILDKVLGTTTDGLIMIDKDYNLMFANEMAIKLLPLRKNDLENKSINQYLSELSPTNSTKLKSWIQKSVNEKRSLRAEFTSQKGKEKNIRIKLTPVIEKNRKCNNIVIGFYDATNLEKKQKTVEKQVKQLTELFKISSLSIANSSTFFSSVLKKTAVILDSELADVYFFDSENDKTGLSKNPDSEIPNLLFQIMKSKRLNEEFMCNHVKNHFQKITRVLRVIATPVKLRNEVIGILYAINKEKNYNSKDTKWLSIIANRLASRIETTKLFEQVEKDGQSLKNIVNNSGDGIIVIDSKGKTIIWNKAIEQITGFKSTQELLKCNPKLLLKYRNIYQQAADNNFETIYQEAKINNYDNLEQWLGVTLSFIQSEGSIEFIIATVRDISSEKAIENRNKEFIYTTTHELRTPITVIKGYLSMILNGDAGDINPKQRIYFNRVFKSTDKLIILVEDLLQVAKLEEDKVIFKKDPFSSHKLMSEVMIDFQQKAKNKNVGLKMSSMNKDIKLMGDYDKTKQVLSNLVDNAIKYTARGNIVINNHTSKNFGVITVEDTGVGIPKKDQSAIFNKFYRVPNSESVKAGGTGLGLFIVKNLIEKQGGKIEITSELGRGTNISILLPLAK
ncbi:MAG: ATP-binding protein [Patescibacteria group bacterium]|nr:ATP-binding protein [Patescibacteria group bacterium]